MGDDVSDKQAHLPGKLILNLPELLIPPNYHPSYSLMDGRMLEGWTADIVAIVFLLNCSIYFSDSCDVALRVSSSSGKDMK